MAPSSVLSYAKQHATKAASWVVMVIVTAAVVVLVGPYLLPRAVNWLGSIDTETEKNVGGAPSEYGIQEIVSAVRAELIATQDALVASEEKAMFQVDTFDIELSFVVKRGATASINTKTPQFLVVGADTEYKKEQIQKIHLHFQIDKPEMLDASIIDNVDKSDEAIELQ